MFVQRNAAGDTVGASIEGKDGPIPVTLVEFKEYFDQRLIVPAAKDWAFKANPDRIPSSGRNP